MKSKKLKVSPGPRLRGETRVPGDKSISHRALMMAAICEGPSLIKGALLEGDCQQTRACLRQLGVGIEDGAAGKIEVQGVGLTGFSQSMKDLDCGRSGTTMRLLAGLLSGVPISSVLTGDAQLLRRPMGRIVAPLHKMGAKIEGRQGNKLAPLAIAGGELVGAFHRPKVASAQVKSAILLAGLNAKGPTRIKECGPTRDHTERMFTSLGILVENDGGAIVLTPPKGPIEGREFSVPGDLSSAAFLVVAATLLPGSDVTLRNVGYNKTRRGLMDALIEMGADIQIVDAWEEGGEAVVDLKVVAAELKGIVLGGDRIVQTIDEIPLLALAATQAQGRTIIQDAQELRHKESDRIAETVRLLSQLGAVIEEREDGMVVDGPTQLHGGLIDGAGDHRLAMMGTVAALLSAQDSEILQAEVMDDSFPGFVRILAALGAKFTVERSG